MKVRLVRPAAVGVPLSLPVLVEKVNPAGRVPVTLKVRAGTPPEAASVVE